MIDLQQDSEDSSQVIPITLISGTTVEAHTWEFGEATSLLTWAPKGFSNRDLDAPALFIERVALEVLQFPSSDLAHRDGLQLQNGRVRAVRHMEFRHVRGDAPERVAILSLPHLAKAALCASAMPIDSSPWPVTPDQSQAIQEILKDCLLKHGGLKC